MSFGVRPCMSNFGVLEFNAGTMRLMCDLIFSGTSYMEEAAQHVCIEVR